MPALPAHAALHLAANHTPAHVAQAAPAGSAKQGGSNKAEEKKKNLPRQTVKSHGYEYIIIDNRLLSQATVRQVVQSAKTPRAAVGALKKAYERQGYFLVALVGRERGKRVLLRVVQGRFTHIKGPRQLTWYFSGLKGNDKVKNSDLIRRATLAQAFDATNGQQPQIRFKPAPEFGGSTMEISQHPLQNYQPVGGALTFGNFGNRYAGHYLAQAQAYAKGHGFTLQANQSRALAGLSQSTHGAYYNGTGLSLSDITPWGIYQLDYHYTKYQLGDAFAPYYPLGRIQTYGFTGTQLLYASARSRWTVKEGFHHISDRETVTATVPVLYPFPHLERRSVALRDQHYDVFNLGSDFNWRFGGLFNRAASLSVGGNIKIGTAPGGDTGFRNENKAGNPTPHFNLYEAHASATQVLPKGVSLKLDVSGQTTPEILPEYEQWVLGGLNNLTAYLPGTVVGDRGYLARFTVQSPTFHAGPFTFSPKAFVEHGAARYSYVPPNTATWQGLTDAGASLSVTLPASKTSATVAYAHPVGSMHVSHATRQGQAAHVFFYVNQPF